MRPGGKTDATEQTRRGPVAAEHVPEPTAAWRSPRTSRSTAARRGPALRARRVRRRAGRALVEEGLRPTITYLTMGPSRPGRAAQGAGHGRRQRRARPGRRPARVGRARHVARAGEGARTHRLRPRPCGMASTDAEMSVVPAMVAERLGVAQLTFAGALSSTGDGLHHPGGRRGDQQVIAALPAVVSVTDQTDEARYPAFRAIMAGKKKPVDDLVPRGPRGRTRVGRAAQQPPPAWCRWHPQPPRTGRHRRRRRRHGAAQLADFLVARGCPDDRAPNRPRTHARPRRRSRDRDPGPRRATPTDVRKATLELLTLARRLGEPAALVCGDATDDVVARARRSTAPRRCTPSTAPEIEQFLVVPKAEAVVTVARQVDAGRGARHLRPRGQGGRRSGRGPAGLRHRHRRRRRRGRRTAALWSTQSVFAGTWSAQSQVVRGTPVITVGPMPSRPQAAPAQPSGRERRRRVHRPCQGRAR